MLYPQNYFKRSQDLSEVYHDAGQFVWGSTEAFLKEKKIFTKKSDIYILPNWRVVDINDKEDWKRAEILMKIIQKYNK